MGGSGGLGGDKAGLHRGGGGSGASWGKKCRRMTLLLSRPQLSGVRDVGTRDNVRTGPRCS